MSLVVPALPLFFRRGGKSRQKEAPCQASTRIADYRHSLKGTLTGGEPRKAGLNVWVLHHQQRTGEALEKYREQRP
jgi:hypothetical protein